MIPLSSWANNFYNDASYDLTFIIKLHKKGFCVIRGIASGEKRHVKMNRNSNIFVAHGAYFLLRWHFPEYVFWNTSILESKMLGHNARCKHWLPRHVDVSPNTCSRAWYTGQTNQNIRVWSRERFIAGWCKETGGSCPTPRPQTLWNISAKHLQRPGKGAGSQGIWSAHIQLSDWLVVM